MSVNKLLAVFCVSALVLVACGVTVDLGTSPSGASTPQDPNAVQLSTMVAQTLGALTQSALLTTPTVTPTPTATVTPMPSSLSVSLATDCYTGPNTGYAVVIIIRPGTVVNVVGKDTADNYWVIDVPGYPGTVCWLPGRYASITGDVNALAAPATPIPSYPLYGRYDPGYWCDHNSHSWWWSHGNHHWDGRDWDDGHRGWYCH